MGRRSMLKTAIRINTAIILTGVLTQARADARLLEKMRSLKLAKQSGRIEQVLPLADGGFLVRTSFLRNESGQGIEVYDRRGQFIRKIGTFGKSPGQYYRLKSLALASDGTIWAADILNRVTMFAQDGRLIGTRLVQNPGYHISSLALDEPRGLYYLAGCLPTQVYLDKGCKLVHQYALHAGGYQRSFLETDPEALTKHLLSVEDYQVDVDDRGAIWATDAPVHKLFRVDPGSGAIQVFPFRTSMATVAALNPAADIDAVGLFEASPLIDRVFAIGQSVIVSIGQLKTGRYVLQVFSRAGKQQAIDMPSPGRLVGRDNSGRLYFARGFEITEYRLR